jgi:hypothetical protein
LQQVTSQTHFLLDQALEFWHRKSNEIHVFSRLDPGPLFFILFESMPKSSIFGHPSKSSWRQNGIQNQPGGAKKQPESIRKASARHIFFQDPFRNASWVPFLWIFEGF